MRTRILFCLLALAAVASRSGGQSEQIARFRLLEPGGHVLPDDFFRVRDAQGVEIAPLGAGGQWAFRDVGRKVTIEFTPKGLKNRGIDIVLENAPTVFVSVMVDPATGRVKYVKQKGMRTLSTPRGRVGKPGSGQLGQSLVPPANDACVDALPIFDGATAFSTVDASTDGAPVPFAQYDGQTYEDVWYLYTPTCNGTMTASTCGMANYDTDLVLYEADANGDGDFDAADALLITNGTEVALAANDDAGTCTGFTSVVATSVTADRTYLVRVGGFGPDDEGSGTIDIACGGAPANDLCAAAEEITCGTSVELTNVAATTAPTDPAFSCAFLGPQQGDGTMWYRFTATSTSAYVSTDGTTGGVVDTLLAVYDGSCGTAIELACDDDGGVNGAGLLSTLCVGGLTIGEEYLIQVASYPGSDLGRITLDLQCPGPCNVPCDDVAEACEISCGGSLTVDNTNATTDPLDPAYSCRFGGAGQGVGTLWFRFVATNASAKVSTAGSLAADTLLAVYGGAPGALVELGCNDDAVGLLSEVCVEGLTVGQTYHVQVGSFSAFDTGEITLSIDCPCLEGFPNDDCTGAASLDPLPESVTVDLTGATSDIAVPCGVFSGPFSNVWYTVTGTGNTLTATTCNPGTLVSDTKISVFCADCLAPVCIGGNDDNCPSGGPVFASTVSWCSQLGAQYLVTVGTFSPFTTPGVVQLDVFDTQSPCETDVECFATGACCLPDGSCATISQADCESQGGSYQGDGTSCESESITDGGFEAGPFSGAWVEFSTFFGTPICDQSCGFGGGTGPRTGSFWAWFGGIAADEDGSLEQNVTIPADATVLEFHLEIPVSSGNGVDFLRVEIDGVTVFEVLEDDPVYAGIGYDLVTIPLGAFADGGVHALRFESSITGIGPGGPAITNFFVDDVSLRVPAYDCDTCVTLDFSTEDDLVTPLGNGQKIDTEFGTLVTITGAGANAGPAIFDSSPGGPNDPSQDRDLLVGRGNLLYLQNSLVPEQTDGFFDRPNDDQDGGDLIFAFASPSAPASVVLVDIDVGTAQASSVTLTDLAGKTRTYTVPAQWTEDILLNGGTGWRTLDLVTMAPQAGFASLATASEQAGFDGTQVVRIRVHLGSSGAVDDLTFCR